MASLLVVLGFLLLWWLYLEIQDRRDRRRVADVYGRRWEQMLNPPETCGDWCRRIMEDG